MLEDRSCLVTRDYRTDSEWVACMSYSLDMIDVQNGKRPLDNDEEENEHVQCKLQKQSDGGVGVVLSVGCSSGFSDEVNEHGQCKLQKQADGGVGVVSVGSSSGSSDEENEHGQCKLQKKADGGVGVVLSVGSSSGSSDEKNEHGQCKLQKQADGGVGVILSVGSSSVSSDEENEHVQCKLQKQADGGVGVVLSLGNSSVSSDEENDDGQCKLQNQSDGGGGVVLSLGNSSVSSDEENEDGQCKLQNQADGGVGVVLSLGNSSVSSDEENEDGQCKLQKQSDGGVGVVLSVGNSSAPSDEQAGNGGSSDTTTLIPVIGRDMSVSSLMRCSRSDYGAIASVNRNFRSLISSGELYELRRKKGVVEHWVYFSCQLLEWDAFDPTRRRWMHLPTMNPNECFVFSDKESLAVGTELLVFGKEVLSHVIYRYSLPTNTWSSGMQMNAPRCLFGSASLGEIAILAGGCDSKGKILSSAELYNSEAGTWTTLPTMNQPRKMCSGVFMDGKFYVIGGIGGGESKLLKFGEEYDLVTGKWTEIPNMSPTRTNAARNDRPATSEAPPLVAVVNNELYAADCADMEVRKYDKQNKTWNTIGRLPERAASMNGWGLAFRACGDKLIVVGGPRAMGEGYIEVNSWVPSEGPPQWNLLGRKRSGSFVYNCAVMGC